MDHIYFSEKRSTTCPFLGKMYKRVTRKGSIEYFFFSKIGNRCVFVLFVENMQQTMWNNGPFKIQLRSLKSMLI